ncbi:hypothetical protein GCM10010320_21790 [Streptomyces caelestis]|nr:hypothetical protein GCM10010320_21790 [Streptomyces caelestis]
MSDLIRCLIAWVGLMATPPGSPHRKPSLSLPSYAVPMSPVPASLPAHRSPYGPDARIDGSSTVAVRPYLVAHEQRQRHHEPAWLAPRSPAAGPYWLHGVEVA